jgi:hypothetical protein
VVPPLRPTLTLADVHGRRVYLLRGSYAEPGRRPGDAASRDLVGSTHLSVAGPLETVVSAATATDAALRLLEQAGLPVTARLRTYRTPTEYVAILHEIGTAPDSVAVQYVHADAELSARAYQVPPHVLRGLNDKGNLAQYVAPEHLPRRSVHEPRDLPPAVRLLREGPVVLKLASRQATGGGQGVFFCRRPEHVSEVLSVAGPGDRIVVEERLDIARSLCVQFAVPPDGRVRYLGTTEQICGADGAYIGNWLDRGDPAENPRATAAALVPVQRGAVAGFRGIVGIDVALTMDDEVRVLDLNFRLNGSTPALLLQPALAARGATVARFGRWTSRLSPERFYAIAGDLVDDGVLVPLATFDPRRSQTLRTRQLLSGLVVGGSRGEVDRRANRMKYLGIA